RNRCVLGYASCLESLAAFVGCLYAGAVVVPACLPRSHGIDERLSTILAHSGARIILTSHRHQSQIARQTSSAPSASPAAQTVAVVASDELEDESEDWTTAEGHSRHLGLQQYKSGA